MSRKTILATAVLAGVVFGAAASAYAVSTRGDDPAEPAPGEQTPPVPTLNRWVRPDSGLFWNSNGIWDNRNLPDEQKAATPWYDPRWKPFAACMQDRDFEVRADGNRPFDESDLDKVIERLNKENPDTARNRTVPPGDYSMGGFTGAFLECAERWLAIQPGDFAKSGIVMLEPGQVPEP